MWRRYTLAVKTWKDESFHVILVTLLSMRIFIICINYIRFLIIMEYSYIAHLYTYAAGSK